MSKAIYSALARVFAVVLVLAGAGAIVGGKIAHSIVSEQLSQEKIDMPDKGGINALKDEGSKEALRPYVGEKLTTGPQAKAFADNYIRQHMLEASGGKTFEEVSSEYMAAKGKSTVTSQELAKLKDLRQTLFEGNSVRGMLLNAYGWWTVGTITMFAGVGLVLVGLILGVIGFGVLRSKKAEKADGGQVKAAEV